VTINKKYVVFEIPEIYPEISGMTYPSTGCRYTLLLKTTPVKATVSSPINNSKNNALSKLRSQVLERI